MVRNCPACPAPSTVKSRNAHADKHQKTACAAQAVIDDVHLNEESCLPYFFMYTGASLCSLTERILQTYMPLAMRSTGTTNW